MTFVLMTMRKSFLTTHSCTLGIAWIYSFSDPEHR